MSVSIPVAGISPSLFQIERETRSFTLLSSLPAPIDVMFGGQLITIPGCREIGRNHDTDADDDPIPGSVVITDLFRFDETTGEVEYVFNALRAVRHILGIQVSPTREVSATSPYANHGISLLPRNAPKDLWKAAAADGDIRVYHAKVERAHVVISEHDEKNAKRKMAGLEPAPPNKEYRQAIQLVTKAEELDRVEAETTVSPHQEDAIDMELELSAMMHAKALELVREGKKDADVDEKALFQRLLQNPKLRKWAEKEWSIRRRGHLPAKKEMLEAAADAGLSTVSAGLEEESEVRKLARELEQDDSGPE